MNCDNLVFDISNLLYRTFHSEKDQDEQTISGLAHHSALVTLNKYYRQFKPAKRVVMAFDRSNWRKLYTTDDQVCLSGKLYKGNRRQNLTPAQQLKYQQFMDHVQEFENIMRKHTSVICLSGDLLEADDLVSGFVQCFNTEHNILITQDRDYLQMLKYDNTRIFDPSTGKELTLEKWNNDPKYFLFEKCFRGDIGDNVQSAYPRLRSTKIKQAYEDPYLLSNLLEHRWTNQDKVEFVVKDIFEENKMLMDLEAQPECVKHKIFSTILTELQSPQSFSYFHFMKYLGSFKMKKVAEQLDQFLPMLSKT